MLSEMDRDIRDSMTVLPREADPDEYGSLLRATGQPLLVREDGCVVTVVLLTFGRARITLARAGDFLTYDDSW